MPVTLITHAQKDRVEYDSLFDAMLAVQRTGGPVTWTDVRPQSAHGTFTNIDGRFAIVAGAASDSARREAEQFVAKAEGQ